MKPAALPGILVSAVLAAALRGRLVSAERDPGLVLTFEVLEARHGGKAAPSGGGRGESPGRDCRVARLLALHVPEGSFPTPLLPAGRFRATWEGFVEVELVDDYAFSAEVRGSFRVELDGEAVLDASGAGPPEKIAEKLAGKTIELASGAHRIVARYESPAEGDAVVRLSWSSPELAPEPIAPALLSHAPGHPGLREGDLLRRGREIVASRKCLRCHPMAGGIDLLGKGMPELAEKAPSLEGIGGRLHAAWMARWISDPRALRPDAAMPRALSPVHPVEGGGREGVDPRALDIAAHLATLAPAGLSAPEPAPSGGEQGGESWDAARGRDLFEGLGCRGCHITEAKADEHGRSSLSRVKEKWKPRALADYLLEPAKFHPASPMPSFRLSLAEARDLAAYLLTLDGGRMGTVDFSMAGAERGKRLLADLGCAACHEMGTSVMPPSAALEAVFAADGRSGCLAESRERRGRAPDFAFTGEERLALRSLAAAGPEALLRDSAEEYAERRIEALRCGGCHARDGRPDVLSRAGRVEPPAPVLQERPDLTWAGEKLRAEWLAALLGGEVKDPVRPWLTVRMPKFSLRADLVARGLAAQHGLPVESFTSPAIDPEMAAAGKRLLSRGEGFSCVTCHDLAGQPAVGVFDARGADLKHTTPRLRREFYRRFMLDPQRTSPGTKMPQFANEGRTSLRNIYDGNARLQLEAIWQHLREIAER